MTSLCSDKASSMKRKAWSPPDRLLTTSCDSASWKTSQDMNELAQCTSDAEATMAHDSSDNSKDHSSFDGGGGSLAHSCVRSSTRVQDPPCGSRTNRRHAWGANRCLAPGSGKTIAPPSSGSEHTSAMASVTECLRQKG